MEDGHGIGHGDGDRQGGIRWRDEKMVKKRGRKRTRSVSMVSEPHRACAASAVVAVQARIRALKKLTMMAEQLHENNDRNNRNAGNSELHVEGIERWNHRDNK